MVLDDYSLVPDGRDIGPSLMKALAEQGKVKLEGGVFMSSPVELPSNSVLEIGDGSELRFIPDFSLYSPVFTRWEGLECWCMHPCLFINGAENVTVKGRGTISGSGEPWWEAALVRKKAKKPETDIELKFASLNPGFETMPGGGGGRQAQFLRPPLLQIRKSKDVLIEGVLFTNSPFWTVHPLFSERVTLKDIRISNPPDAPNTDGIDIESSVDVLVTGCSVSVGDDGIAVKSGSGEQGMRENMPARSIHIKDCRVYSSHGGAVIGSETAAEISDVTVEDCVFDRTDRGIRIKTRRGRGGYMHGLVFRNLIMRDNLAPFVINSYYHCGNPLPEDFSLEKRPVTATTPRIEDILVENCHATGARATAGMAVGLPEMPLKNVVVRNSSFSVSPDASEDISSTDMYTGLPDPPSRGFRVRYAELTLDGFTVEAEGESVILEEGVSIRPLPPQGR